MIERGSRVRLFRDRPETGVSANVMNFHRARGSDRLGRELNSLDLLTSPLFLALISRLSRAAFKSARGSVRARADRGSR